jgi:hypothetical protein
MSAPIERIVITVDHLTTSGTIAEFAQLEQQLDGVRREVHGERHAVRFPDRAWLAARGTFPPPLSSLKGEPSRG